MKKLKCIAPLLILTCFIDSGCAWRTKILPGNDPLVVEAERTLNISRDTFDLFVTLEYKNRDIISKVLPDATLTADRFRADLNKNGRADALDWIDSLNTVKKAYKSGAASKDALVKAIAVLSESLTEAQKYINFIDVTVPTPVVPKLLK